MFKQTILGAVFAVAALGAAQSSMAQPAANAAAHRYQYTDSNGGVHWDRAGWRRAEEVRKQREAAHKRELQRQHQAEQRREREERQRARRH